MTWQQTEITQEGKTIRGGYPVENAKEFFAEVVRREDEIKALKDELKDAIDAFASCNNLTSKGIQRGIRDFKKHLKNEAIARVEFADADTLFESLVSA